MLPVTDAWLSDFAQPAVLCDAHGLVCSWNRAFEEMFGHPLGARIKYQSSSAVLTLSTGQSLPVAVIAREDGRYFAHLLSQPSVRAVVQLLSRGMVQLQETLESSAAMGLMDEPDGPMAPCLREVLAASQELGRLRRQLSLLGMEESAPRSPVSLRSLMKDVADSFDSPIRFPEGGPRCPVQVSAEQLFPALVGLMELLVRNLHGSMVEVDLSEGEQVRLTLRAPGAELVHALEIETARTTVLSQGGRLLVVGDTVLIELPSCRSPGDIARVERGATVLVVDDDDLVLGMMESALSRAGFRVLLAENGVEGSVLLREHPEINALVTDAMLPGRSGLELGREARLRNLPVLLVSGHDRELLGELDMPVLTKPFGSRQLAETVGRMVEEQ